MNFLPSHYIEANFQDFFLNFNSFVPEFYGARDEIINGASYTIRTELIFNIIYQLI
jgi:hypothetical protein